MRSLKTLTIGGAVLKISKKIDIDTLVLILEGELAGPWVEEVERTWKGEDAGKRFSRSKFDLSGLTFVSREGRRLLQQLFADGVELVSSDLLTRSIVDEISRKRG